VTIGTLPDDVLLEIFKFFIDQNEFHFSPSEEWHTLVHVCRRWRNLAFTFLRHLNLVLSCRPPYRSVKDLLDIWPELPIYIDDSGHPSKEARDDVVDALKLNHRVSRIRLESASFSAWETLAPLIQRPFPALTHLWIDQPAHSMKDVIPRSFLGGSAPCLRVLLLDGVSFPALPELLSSSTNLVRLWHDNIPDSGYISPEAMSTCLPALTGLKSLSLTFRPESFPYSAIRIPPPDTRILLPALTDLHFQGAPEYMEDLVAQIDAPSLESLAIGFFPQELEVLQVSELAKFVRRADKLSLADRAKVTFGSAYISIVVFRKLRVDPKTLMLNFENPESHLQLLHLVQFCTSCLSTLSTFECLHIIGPLHGSWAGAIDRDDLDPQWLELLRPFNNLKDLHLSHCIAPYVAQGLRGLPVERVTEVLPALENVFISSPQPFAPVNAAISQFANTRQLSGHPVSIHWEESVHVGE